MSVEGGEDASNVTIVAAVDQGAAQRAGEEREKRESGRRESGSEWENKKIARRRD
jgi:hypothetical protein